MRVLGRQYDLHAGSTLAGWPSFQATSQLHLTHDVTPKVPNGLTHNNRFSGNLTVKRSLYLSPNGNHRRSRILTDRPCRPRVRWRSRHGEDGTRSQELAPTALRPPSSSIAPHLRPCWCSSTPAKQQQFWCSRGLTHPLNTGFPLSLRLHVHAGVDLEKSSRHKFQENSLRVF